MTSFNTICKEGACSVGQNAYAMGINNIDIISNAEGQVIPAGDVKTIQHLEGGIIDQILVKESDIVKEGDFLGQIAIDNNVSVKEIMSWNDLKSTIIYKDQNLILMPKAQSHNDKLFPLKINKQKYFWEVAAVYAKTSIKTLCNYNFYHELKPNQKLIIIKK